MSNDPERVLRYPLSWPAWMADKVAEAANTRAMSVATWMREAALEKLERSGGRAATSGIPALITHWCLDAKHAECPVDDLDFGCECDCHKAKAAAHDQDAPERAQ